MNAQSEKPKLHSLRDGYPLLDRVLPASIFNHLVAAIAEFLGTVFFLFFALAGMQVANLQALPLVLPHLQPITTTETAPLLYTALSFGFSLTVSAWVFFRVTSGLFNPAVTMGMCLIGSLGWARGVIISVVQVLGGIAAAALVSCMFPGPLEAETLLSPDTSITRGFFIEALVTAAFVFSIFMIAADKHKGTLIAPFGIGLALFVAELVTVPFTGGSLNPARAFGPAVVNHSFPSYHWLYWVAPLFGLLLSALLFKIFKRLEVEMALASPKLEGTTLGHHHVASNPNNTPVPMSPRSGHVLKPVAEQDVEKGPEELATAASVGMSPASHAQPQYLSGMTAVNNPSASDMSADIHTSRASAQHQRSL